MARNLTLLTDLYQLTMAQGYWQQLKPGIDAIVTAAQTALTSAA